MRIHTNKLSKIWLSSQDGLYTVNIVLKYIIIINTSYFCLFIHINLSMLNTQIALSYICTLILKYLDLSFEERSLPLAIGVCAFFFFFEGFYSRDGVMDQI